MKRAVRLFCRIEERERERKIDHEEANNDTDNIPGVCHHCNQK